MIKITDITLGDPKEIRSGLETVTYETLKKLNIEFWRVDNDPVEAMEDCVEISNTLGAQIRKSILVCNRKKTEFHLVILPADKPFDTKVFCEKLNCSRVSFTSGDTMKEVLGLEPGSLTIMSILNDKNNLVKVVIDESIAKDDYFACNPGANTTHIKFKTEDLFNKLLPYANHKATILKL